MRFGHAWNVLTAAVALAAALTVIGTSLLASLCLLQYVVLTIFELESETFRDYVEDHERGLSLVKLSLLVIAILALVF